MGPKQMKHKLFVASVYLVIDGSLKGNAQPL
jgi:hypothetical protein